MTSADSSNSPEKYIFYQTLLIVVTKLLAISTILLLTYQRGFDYDWVRLRPLFQTCGRSLANNFQAFTTFVLTDISTTPFVIQGSYLLCNRTNVDTILSIQFKKLKTWKMIICGGGSVSEGRQRRREFKMKIYEAKRKAQEMIRGDKTITKLVVNVIPINRRTENVT